MSSGSGRFALRARGLAAAVLLATLAAGGRARAEAAPDRYRSTAYYAGQAGAIAALFGGGAALTLVPHTGRGGDPCWFPGDVSLRGRWAPGAAALSDALIAVTLSAPMAAALGKGASPRLLNTSIVYGETLGANLLLSSVSKAVFHRPRPYTYRFLSDADADADEDADWYVSFYSGHSSTAFAAAVSGSYLFAESAPDTTSSALFAGIELTLASATAVLRTRAGKHYYSDIVVGALIGIGLGVGVPIANGGRYRPKGAELAAAGGGVVLGATVAALLPFEDRGPEPKAEDSSWMVLPGGVGETGVGLSAVGTF